MRMCNALYCIEKALQMMDPLETLHKPHINAIPEIQQVFGEFRL